MKSTMITFLGLLATAVIASPAPNGYGGGGDSYDPCRDLLDGTAQCCATDILGLADLDCAGPVPQPDGPEDFQDICAGYGKRARCCVLPVLGQALLCQNPLGL
ncbi:Cerato-ulmin hydrophobin family [Xylaria sp. CBS 124048]|nr:Cerato-ulmin hydrophobin family [Xylaria sp. CBS 124048]